ncbi:MAG TPA: hypothetical protein VM733_14225 [Thermoanaerobaculia bacterium]|nr:hypothetical protein [Thermoanaerobaculia bacterium]
MLVFTTGYLDDLNRRWASRPENEWPLVVHIALKDRSHDVRERIERYVRELDSADQSKIARNLQSEKQFITTFGELMIGHVLVTAGLRPRYEPELHSSKGACTPDWYFNGSSPVVCDVFTAGLLQQRDADDTALRDIQARLAAIRGGYMILLEVDDASSLDSRGRKELAAEVERWLQSGVRKGDKLRVRPALLEVLLVGASRLDLLTTESMHIVQTPPKLSENFMEKAKKYAPLGFPVIAAAVKHYRAEIDETDVEDVLLGQLAYVSRETSSGQIVERTERLDDGVFTAEPNSVRPCGSNRITYPSRCCASGTIPRLRKPFPMTC